MKQIKIACVNDFHAALQQTEATPGCARFFTAISRWKAENPGSIVVFGGDDYKGDPTSEYADGAPVTALMRQLGVQASALGNHELDYPVSQLKHWQQEGGYRFVCANLKDQETGELPDFVIPYVILRCNEIKIALIGLATQENLNTSGHPADIRKFVITDPVKATKKWCRWLKDGNDPSGIPDAVIALTHLGLQFDQENIPTGEEMCALCCADAGIDGAFAAHWHQLMATWIGSVPVAQGGSYGKLPVYFK